MFNAAIVDAGVQPHPALASGRWVCMDFARGSGRVRSFDRAPGPDEGAHAVLAASAIELRMARHVAGAAPDDCSLLIAVPEAGASIDEFDANAAAAVGFAVQQGVPVIYVGWISPHPLPRLAAAMAEAAERTLFVAPAGNHSGDIDRNPVSPAAWDHPNLLVVTTDRLMHLGPRDDDVGHGRRSVDVVASGTGTELRTEAGVEWFGDSSAAAAHAAGLAAALAAEHPRAPPQELRRRVLDQAERPPTAELAALLASCTTSSACLRF